MKDQLYYYKLHVTDVYDGDTITGNLDLGFNQVTFHQRFRLYGLDTPEVRGKERPEGLVSRDWLRELILGKTIVVRTYPDPKGRDRKGKYGRWLVELFDDDGNSINDRLIAEDLAEAVDY